MWIGLLKFILGTVVVGLVSLLVSSGLKEKELEMLALEKETKQLEMFMSLALRPPEERRAFALYFSTLARDEKLKAAWNAYLSIAEAEIEQAEVRKKQQLQEAGAVAAGVAAVVNSDLQQDNSLLRRIWSEAAGQSKQGDSGAPEE